mmetsp:Transcript_59428/g.150579  ORF Transcript_59428/g.150579 Transcript_59428/m.150579 type:complete len:396 (-) Transcript_59428:93-1280(-)
MAPFTRRLSNILRWGLRQAWPRIGVHHLPGGSPDMPGCLVKVLDRSPTPQDAEWKLWGCAREFVPPFRALLAPFGQEREEGALVHLTVTHMLSDGYSVVPLLDDLANLVGSVEAAVPLEPCGNGNREASRLREDQAPQPALPLPPVPSMFAVMEKRIFRTIEGVDDVDGLSPRITPHALAGKKWANAHTTFATIPAEAVAAIRRSAVRLAVPDDIAMLTLLGVTLAWFYNKTLEQIAMIVPQRDGLGENDMVGLFSDVRHLCICTEGLSFAGVALRLHHIVKERLWTVPAVRTQFDFTLINFEWTDFQEKQGFAQHVTCSERGESSFHPLRIAVDQPERQVWRMRVAFQEGKFTEQQRESFFDLFEKSLRMLQDNPLELIWPAGSLDSTATVQGQ